MERVQLAHGFVRNYPTDTCTSNYYRIYLPMETCIMPMVNLYKSTWKYGHSLKKRDGYTFNVALDSSYVHLIQIIKY